MDNNKDNQKNNLPSAPGEHHKNPGANADLPDSPHDAERLKQENFTIDLPDVKDIPGQENITPLSLGELADTTISSADEEGDGLFDEEDNETGPFAEADVTREEKQLLKRAGEEMPIDDDTNLHRAALDNKDMEGEKLNEGSFGEDISGDDLDVPGASDDDSDEAIGEEDEENNNYSLGSDDNDDAKEDAF